MDFSSFNSSSVVMHLILLWYSVALFPILSTNASYLTDGCHETKNPTFCLMVMNSDPRTPIASPLQHEIIAIDLTASRAADTKLQIQALITQTTDPRLKEIYSLCESYYGAAVDAMRVAKEFSKAGQHSDVINVAQFASNDVSNCEKTFQQPPPRASTLSDANQKVDLLSNIVAVFANLLIR